MRNYSMSSEYHKHFENKVIFCLLNLTHSCLTELHLKLYLIFSFSSKMKQSALINTFNTGYEKTEIK